MRVLIHVDTHVACGHISSETKLLGPKDHLTIKDSFT